MPVYRFGDILVDPQKYPWGYSFQQWALEFDGDSDYVDTPLYPQDGNKTLEGWIRYNAVYSSGWGNCLAGAHDDNDRRLYITMNGDEIASAVGDSFIIIQSMETNRFYHIALVANSGSAYCYLDGVEIGSFSYTWNSGASQTPLRIGTIGVTTHDHFLDGAIADVRYWNTARTQQQIQDNMNKRLTGNETGLVAYWPINEGEGITVYDDAGSNDGTVYGATWVEI